MDNRLIYVGVRMSLFGECYGYRGMLWIMSNVMDNDECYGECCREWVMLWIMDL